MNTWMGETAAAGAVRTGMALSGLLSEEYIGTVWAGPSAKSRAALSTISNKSSCITSYISKLLLHALCEIQLTAETFHVTAVWSDI